MIVDGTPLDGRKVDFGGHRIDIRRFVVAPGSLGQRRSQFLSPLGLKLVLGHGFGLGLDLLFEDRTAAGGGSGRSYYAVDDLGSTRALTNASGAVTDTDTYDPYGNPITSASSGTTRNEFGYAGYQADAATGEDYLRARYYDTASGRFTSRDSREGVVPEDY